MRRLLRWGSAAFLLGLAGLLLILGLLSSKGGSRWVVDQLNRWGQGVVSIADSQGIVTQQWQAQGIVLTLPTIQVRLSQLRWDWDFAALRQGQLHWRQLQLGQLHITSQADDTPPQAPTDLQLPLAVAVDRFELAALLWGPEQTLLMQQVALRFDSDGRQHQLQLQQLDSPLLLAQAQGRLRLDGKAPFPLQADIDFQAGQATAHGTLALRGQLARIGVALQARHASDFNSHLQLTAFPFAAAPWQKIAWLQGHVRQFNPQQWLPTLPAGQWQAEFRAQGDQQAMQGEFWLDNQQPAKWGKGVPVRRIEARWQWREPKLMFDHFTIDTLGGPLQAAMTVSAEQLQAQLHTTQPLQLAQLAPDLPPLQPALDLQLAGPWQALVLQAKVTEQQRRLTLAADLVGDTRGKFALQAVKLSQLRLQDGTGSLQAAGAWQAATRQQPAKLSLTGELQGLNPAHYHPDWPQGKLGLSFTAEGQWQAEWLGKLQFVMLPSQLQQQPLQGEGKLQWQAERLQVPQLSLRLGSNQLSLAGAFGQVGDRLTAQIHAPNLAQLGGDFSGQVQAKAQFAGRFTAPEVQFELQAKQVVWPQWLSVAEAEGRGELQLAATSPFKINVALRQLRLPRQKIAVSQLSLQGQGQRQQHQLQLQMTADVAGQAVQNQLRWQGGFQEHDMTWRGTWQQWQQQAGAYSVTLMAPTALMVSPSAISLENARFKLAQGDIAIQQLQWRPQGWQSRGWAKGIVPTLWLPAVWLQQPDWHLESQLQLAAEWNVQNQAGDWQGQVNLQREQGDITVITQHTASQPLPLQLRQATLQAVFAQQQLTLRTQWQSVAGQLTASVQLPLRQGQLRPDSPLQGQVQWQLADLTPISHALWPQGKASGQFAAALTLTGSWQRPLWQGQLSGDRLSVQAEQYGIAWQQGQLRAQMRDNRLQIETLSFQGQQGSLRLQNGQFDLLASPVRGSAELVLDQLLLRQTPSRELVVSGQTQATVDASGIQLLGKLVVVRGMMDVPEGDAPQLAADVVVKGRARPLPAPPATLPLQVQLNISLPEEALRVRGRGLDAWLSGELLLKALPKQAPQLSGVIRVDRGKFTAYGQELAIERGEVTFQGLAENPALDIVAMRRGLAVEAGVAITGSASQPKARLVSEPTVPDAQKLSWLILGRDSFAGGSSGDVGLLLAAGSALLSDRDAVSVQQRIADTFGLDELSIRQVKGSQAQSPQQQLLSVGKRLSDALSISYQQSLSGTTQLMLISYRLSKHWSLIGRTGSENAIDVFYTLPFDRPPKRP